MTEDGTSDDERSDAVSRVVPSLPSVPRSSGDVADPVREQWRAELASVGGRSPLLHFVDDPGTRVELSATPLVPRLAP